MTIKFKSRIFTIINKHPRWDFYIVQEQGRNFKTMIAFDENYEVIA